MDSNVLGLVYSFSFIFAVHLSSETVRKIIHIGVSNWVFILTGCFNTLSFALIGPVTFIILNGVFVYSGAAKLLGMGNRKRDNGLIYFPFSLLVMTLLYYRGLIQAHCTKELGRHGCDVHRQPCRDSSCHSILNTQGSHDGSCRDSLRGGDSARSG